MKKPLAKLAFALILSAAALVTSAQPSHAIYCGSRPGCSFTGAVRYGNSVCCTWNCGDQLRIGPCYQS